MGVERKEKIEKIQIREKNKETLNGKDDNYVYNKETKTSATILTKRKNLDENHCSHPLLACPGHMQNDSAWKQLYAFDIFIQPTVLLQGCRQRSPSHCTACSFGRHAFDLPDDCSLTLPLLLPIARFPVRSQCPEAFSALPRMR